MSMECGQRFEGYYNPYNFPEGNEEQRISEEGLEKETLSWLSDIISPQLVERAREYPACKDWSAEQHIYQRLLGVLVESGPELNPHIRQRLRNLVGIFRAAAFPNMTPNEQQSIIQWSQATTFDVSKLEYELDDNIIEDIQWLWRTFNLRVPRTTPDMVSGDIARVYGLLSSHEDN